MKQKHILGALCLALFAIAAPVIASPPDSPPASFVAESITAFYADADGAYIKPALATMLVSAPVHVVSLFAIDAKVDVIIARHGEYRSFDLSPSGRVVSTEIRQMTTAPPGR